MLPRIGNRLKAPELNGKKIGVKVVKKKQEPMIKKLNSSKDLLDLDDIIVKYANAVETKKEIPENHISRRNKCTMADCHRVASEKGLICLSTEYKNADTHMKWKHIDCGREFSATFHRIKQAVHSGCHPCAINKQRKGIEYCREVARKKNITCLTEEYKNALTRMDWQCNECKYEWTTNFAALEGSGGNKGSGCPNCAGCAYYTLEECIKIGKEKDLECLSTEYKNINTYMEWKHIPCGTTFTTNLSCILKSKYASCRKCSSDAIRHDIEHCHEIAKSKGLKCLSDTYIDCKSYLRWLHIECGYEWDCTLGSIKRSETESGCPNCWGNIKHTMEEILQIAEEKNVIALFDEYKNGKIKMPWQCKTCDFKWDAPLYSIKHDISRCYKCTTFLRSEPLCKELMEQVFDMLFKKCKPKFLQGMELDGYNEEHKLAWEYQGEYHFNYIPFYHRNGLSDLQKRKDDDQRKRDLCKENGITLLEVPYQYNHEDPEAMQLYIEELRYNLEYGKELDGLVILNNPDEMVIPEEDKLVIPKLPPRDDNLE
jgi:hypothetical protein